MSKWRGELPILDWNIMSYPISANMPIKQCKLWVGEDEIRKWTRIQILGLSQHNRRIRSNFPPLLVHLFSYKSCKRISGHILLLRVCFLFLYLWCKRRGDCKIRLRIDGITVSLVICKVLAPFLTLLLSYWFNWKTFCVNFLCHQMTIFHLFVAAYQKSQTLASKNYNS